MHSARWVSPSTWKTSKRTARLVHTDENTAAELCGGAFLFLIAAALQLLQFLDGPVIVTAADSNLSIGAANILSILLLGVMTIVGVFAFTKYRAMNYKVKMAKGVNSLKLYEKMSAVFINIPMIAAIAIMVITTLTSISAV